jgi:hypothetical protein
MKTRSKNNDIKKEFFKINKEVIKINKEIFKNNKILYKNFKNNESLELINEEKNKSVEYGTFINHIVNLSKLLQMNIISKYRDVLTEIPSSQFILDIIINLPMKDCNPEDSKFIELIYILWKSELNNKK